MQRSANEVMQSVIFSAVLDAVAALKGASKGLPNTLPVTVEEICYHTRAVARAVRTAHLVSDMPFMSYQASTEQAVSRRPSVRGTRKPPYAPTAAISSRNA